MSDAVVKFADASRIIASAKEYVRYQCSMREKFDARNVIRLLADMEGQMRMASYEVTQQPHEEHSLAISGKCQSKSERTVARAIKELGYTPYHNVIKKDCIGDKRPLPFDFGILVDGKELLIEFDGEQHAEPIAFYGGTEKFERVKRYDSIKTKYCSDRCIPLLRLNKCSSIKNELRQFIESHTEDTNAQNNHRTHPRTQPHGTARQDAQAREGLRTDHLNLQRQGTPHDRKSQVYTRGHLPASRGLPQTATERTRAGLLVHEGGTHEHDIRW